MVKLKNITEGILMSEINNLIYFFESIQDLLPFENENDFKTQINESKEFRIKVQKLVYLSKFFGWDNPYVFTLAPRGPYSVELKHIYSKVNLFDNESTVIADFNKDDFVNFSKNKNTLFLEAATTILYTLGENILNLGADECVYLIHSLKQHLSSEIIKDAYYSVLNYNLYNKNSNITKSEIISLSNEINNDISQLTEHFEAFEGSRNKIIVLGSVDYMRIALREANLNMVDEYDLMIFVQRYLVAIEQISTKYSPDEFIELDLKYLEEFFDQFQKYVSEELKIIKKIDDDDFDESLCYR